MIYYNVNLAGRTVGGETLAQRLARTLAPLNPPFNVRGERLEISVASGGLVDFITTGVLDDLETAGIALTNRTAAELIEAHGTAAYKAEVFNRKQVDEAREALRAAAAAPLDTPDLTGTDLAGDANKEDAERQAEVLGALAGAHDGICLGRAHRQQASLDAIADAVENGRVDLLFLEEFTTEEQAEINAYLNGPDEDLPATLQTKVEVLWRHFDFWGNFSGTIRTGAMTMDEARQHIRDMGVVDWGHVLKSARKNGVRIYAIDSAAARETGESSGTEAFGEQRTAMMNAVIKEVMDSALAEDANAGKTYMAVVGAAHSNTHRGGIPGVSQMYGIPSVRLADTGDIVQDHEDESLRGMPSRDEQAWIDKAIADLYRRGDAAGDSQKALRDRLTADAARLTAAGAMPSAEESLIGQRYIEEMLRNAPGPLDDRILEVATERKIRADLSRLKAEFDTANRRVVVALDRYLKQSPKPPDADALASTHDAARADATAGDLKALMAALSKLDYVERRMNGEALAAPAAVDLSTCIAGIDGAAVTRDMDDARRAVDEFDAIAEAIRAGDHVRVAALLRGTPDAIHARDDKTGQTLLHLAARTENVDVMNAIFTEAPGVRLDLPDADGNTPLHLACRTRRVDRETDTAEEVRLAQAKQNAAVSLLIDKGANIDAANADGRTPLHLTALSYNTDVLETLFAAGADVTATDSHGWTPLETSIAATSTAIEQVFYARDKAPRPSLADPVNPGSTIDVLCRATLCENPKDAAKVRLAYEQAFANPEMRPLLELVALDAASPRDPPDSGSRFVIADGSTADSLIQRKAGDHAMGYRGGYDKTAGVVHVSSDTQGVDFAGVLMHELTHRATQVAHGGRVVPFDPVSATGEQDYIAAIEADIKAMHLLVPTSPVEAEARRCIMERMGQYAMAPGEDGGDPALLQEFIVSIPQLMASFGPEKVRHLAPNLWAEYLKFKTACTAKASEARFDTARGGIDDTGVTGTPRDFAQDAAATWIAPDAGVLDLDRVVATVKQDYAVHHGRFDDAGMRDADEHHGPLTLNKLTIRYDVGKYKIPPEQEDAVNAKLARIRRALEKSLADEMRTLPMATDAFREIVTELSGLAHTTAPGDLEKVAREKADSLIAKAKMQYLDRKIVSGETLSDVELAEAITLSAERSAAAGLAGDFHVDRGNHATMVEKLVKRLGRLDPGAKSDWATQRDLIESFASTLTRGDKAPVRIKTGMKLFGTRDPALVSIDVKAMKRKWVAIARQLV